MTTSQEIGDPERPLRTKASFIGKMFGKQKETISKQSEDKPAEVEYEKYETIDNDPSSLPRGLKQAAVVRPLGHRLQARWAGRPNARPAQSHNVLGSEVSAITKARLRGESFARLEGRVSDEQQVNAMEEENLDSGSELPKQATFNHGFEPSEPERLHNSCEPAKGEVQDHPLGAGMKNPLRYSFLPPEDRQESSGSPTSELLGSHASTSKVNHELLIQDFAAINGIGPGGVEQWKYYLQCYTEVWNQSCSSTLFVNA